MKVLYSVFCFVTSIWLPYSAPRHHFYPLPMVFLWFSSGFAAAFLRKARNHENGSISAPMARLKLSMSATPIAGRDEVIGMGPGPWKEAPDPKNGVGGMAKPFK